MPPAILTAHAPIAIENRDEFPCRESDCPLQESDISMRTRVERRTVDLSDFPDLVVIYLGMRVNRITGIKTLLGFGPKISASAAAHPDGLLRHETVFYSLFPMHVGMRQYWRDTDSLLKWTRSEPQPEAEKISPAKRCCRRRNSSTSRQPDYAQCICSAYAANEISGVLRGC